MTKRIGGGRRKTRAKFRKNIRQKGKMSLTKYFQKFEEGDRIKLIAESAIQKGIYHRRFHGKSGIVTGKRGHCYKIDIKDGNKPKEVIVHPVHLARL
ncbi:50S ribosomal protein L21e [Candidatus Woesearchaeota archaeon]|jgi:large subunit ribosomal protein L21e|nr:50S ribosomal protein L21e [Candidatus Woesearchaeota archaeon]